MGEDRTESRAGMVRIGSTEKYPNSASELKSDSFISVDLAVMVDDDTK